ncbi:MAG TPA: right-handed parallel beta-helix repeat-containing protein [Pirellulales bacterium]|nr:right-handed parallel beta-helix repeat-containing protein [Pirellulales bacterium]
MTRSHTAWFKVSALALMLVGCAPAEAQISPTAKAAGAVGDGVADDSAAIQRAIDTGTGGIGFTSGTYRLSKTILIDLDKTGFVSLVGDGNARIVMAGAGPAFHFKGTHAGTADPTTVKPEVWERQRMPVVRGLEIVGDHAEADGIEATGVMQLTICETAIRECRDAIHLTERNRNIILSACHFYHNRGCGVFYDHVDLHQSNIVGCHISYCAMGGVVFRGGNVRNVHIGTCDIESNMTDETPDAANVLIDCSGGSTAEVAITGCTLQHNSKSLSSANIRVLGRGQQNRNNPAPTQEGHITITGNVMSDVQWNIVFDGVRGATIIGNTFWQAQRDLIVEHSQAIVVGPNNMDRNPRYLADPPNTEGHGSVVFNKCTDCKITGLLMKGILGFDGALVLDKCQRTTVTDCSILDSDCMGLWVRRCKHCRVTDCVVRDDRENPTTQPALKLEGGSDNWVHDNIFAGKVEADPDAGIVESNR